ncbi:basic proline-rich protein-like [Cynocephalus volans]|uniref:basic proline-rich protein-like n=1 Tax=Cynocephalus volans TaxID=110931 RepID=UPI002FC5D044
MTAGPPGPGLPFLTGLSLDTPARACPLFSPTRRPRGRRLLHARRPGPALPLLSPSPHAGPGAAASCTPSGPGLRCPPPPHAGPGAAASSTPSGPGLRCPPPPHAGPGAAASCTPSGPGLRCPPPHAGPGPPPPPRPPARACAAPPPPAGPGAAASSTPSGPGLRCPPPPTPAPGPPPPASPPSPALGAQRGRAAGKRRARRLGLEKSRRVGLGRPSGRSLPSHPGVRPEAQAQGRGRATGSATFRTQAEDKASWRGGDLACEVHQGPQRGPPGRLALQGGAVRGRALRPGYAHARWRWPRRPGATLDALL